jgi:hypothetical protein
LPGRDFGGGLRLDPVAPRVGLFLLFFDACGEATDFCSFVLDTSQILA